MSAIDITIKEVVCGTTTSLSFSISPEALRLLLQDEPDWQLFSSIQHGQQEMLVEEVSREIRQRLESMRLELHSILLSAYTKFLKDNYLKPEQDQAA